MESDEFTIYSYSNSDILRNISVAEVLSPLFIGEGKRDKGRVWSNTTYTFKERIVSAS